MTAEGRLRKIAFIGDYVPRECGIATFTADLVESVASQVPESKIFVVAMNDTPSGYEYPARVRFEIFQNDHPGYRRAADFLNISHVDIACVQHEYGIYGGESGGHLLDLLKAINIPVVTTFHTVLKNPNYFQKSVLEEIASLSQELVVMSSRAADFLKTVYNVPEDKIKYIPHGVPNVPFVDPNYFKDLFGLEGRRVILTFGLLTPGKGIEYMIKAMPAIVRKYPDMAYVILGATHPHIIRSRGEEYRLMLQRLARDLGVEKQVIFHNRFVSAEELSEFVGAADVYVTPYINAEQITSGALAYAVGAGKATVSTPYWHAEELLADGRGVLVPFKDKDALAQAIIGLFDNEVERHAMRKRAYAFGRQMVWSEVAKAYINLFASARESLARKPQPLTVPWPTAHYGAAELPSVRLDHLMRLTDDTGILQHAIYTTPNYHEGYCTDDNARALMVALAAAEESTDTEPLYSLAYRYLAFLNYAFDRNTSRFRNFLLYHRKWKEDPGSEDAHGRALWGLGAAVAYCRQEGVRNLAANLFELALGPVETFTSPRAWAFTIVGIHEYLRHYEGATEVRRKREALSQKLLSLWNTVSGEGWPWFETSLAYANAALSQAMILSGQWMQRSDMFDCGIKSLDWLCRIQTSSQGHFAPVGSNGFYAKGGQMAKFDQQPIEAATTVSACFEAYRATKDNRWLAEARKAFEWFLGANDLSQPLYDSATGGCCDGLHPDRPNLNEGAESTLSWLIALLEMLGGERVRKEKT